MLYLKRGEPFTLEQYGKTAQEATGDQLKRRYNTGWRGNGAYSASRNFRQWATQAIRNVGRGVGAAANQRLLSSMSAGDNSGSPQVVGPSGATGSGAYAIHNQLINPTGPDKMIDVADDETNDIVISHSEFLKDIIPTSAAFQSQGFYYLNPGLASTFPWLSQIAQYFEEYQWGQLIFEVRSMVTEGNSTAAGTVIHCTQYNPLNPAFTSKANMENYDYAVSHKVTDHGHHGIECDPEKRSGSPAEYVRTGLPPSGSDLKTYDLGTYQVATSGAASGVLIGELWVHYSVKLRKTKIPDIGASSLYFAQCTLTSTQNNNNFYGNGSWAVSGSSSIVPTITGGGTSVPAVGSTSLVITLPATVSASIKYDVTVTMTDPSVAGSQFPVSFTMTATNAVISSDLPSRQSLGGTFTAATCALASASSNFTPNGAGVVVLTLVNYAASLPTSGPVTITINPSAL